MSSDQDERETIGPVRQLQAGQRNAVSLAYAINEVDTSDDIVTERLPEAAGSVVWTVLDLLKRFGQLVLGAWPLVLVGLLSVRLWFAFGIRYFEAPAVSWTSALAMYGLATILYLAHQMLSQYWLLYNSLRVTNRF